LGKQPDELKELSHMEQAIISQITPLVTFVDLKHNTIGTQGNTISLKRNVGERVRLLFHKLNNTDIVYVRSLGLTGKPNGKTRPIGKIKVGT
jgi:hypothetical protein